MIEAGIFDGDQVIVRQQQTANNGDIIVAMTEDNEATVKRFFSKRKTTFAYSLKIHQWNLLFSKTVRFLVKSLVYSVRFINS